MQFSFLLPLSPGVSTMCFSRFPQFAAMGGGCGYPGAVHGYSFRLLRLLLAYYVTRQHDDTDIRNPLARSAAVLQTQRQMGGGTHTTVRTDGKERLL